MPRFVKTMQRQFEKAAAGRPILSPPPLTERVQSHELLGAREDARGYYKKARAAGADDWVTEQIKVLKSEEEAKEEEQAREKSASKAFM